MKKRLNRAGPTLEELDDRIEELFAELRATADPLRAAQLGTEICLANRLLAPLVAKRQLLFSALLREIDAAPWSSSRPSGAYREIGSRVA